MSIRAGSGFIATPEMTNVVDRKGERLLKDLPGESDLKEISAFSDAAKAHRVWLLSEKPEAKMMNL